VRDPEGPRGGGVSSRRNSISILICHPEVAGIFICLNIKLLHSVQVSMIFIFSA
jgi:hypothetical protein